MPSHLTRRHILAGAAATAAVAAMPTASAIAAVERAPMFTLPDPSLMAWTPGRAYRQRELIAVSGRWHVVMFDHVADAEPSDRYLSRPLRIDGGIFVEEDA
jgi:hypothetical protein